MAILAKSSATKSLTIAREPRKERDYAGKKASEKVAQARLAEVKDILDSEKRYEIVMTDLSLADVQAIHDALVSARSSWRTSEYGEVYGGKALKAGYAAGLVMSKRLARLLGKTKAAVEKIQTSPKSKKRSK